MLAYSSLHSRLVICRYLLHLPRARAVVSHYTTMIKSVQSLHDRITILHRYLSDVRAGVHGSGGGDQQLLRELKGLCMRLPVMTSPTFRGSLLSEYNDALLVTYLASITKATLVMADVADKFAVAQKDDIGGKEFGVGGSSGGPQDRRGGRGGMDDDMIGVRSSRGARSSQESGGGGLFSSVIGSLLG
jgi:hypothetical protein